MFMENQKSTGKVAALYPFEMEKVLLRRKPRFLHKQKLKLVFLEMHSNIEQFKEETEKYEDLIATNSLLINFPVKEPLMPTSWNVYNTFINLLNYHD